MTLTPLRNALLFTEAGFSVFEAGARNGRFLNFFFFFCNLLLRKWAIFDLNFDCQQEVMGRK